MYFFFSDKMFYYLIISLNKLFEFYTDIHQITHNDTQRPDLFNFQKYTKLLNNA